MRLLKYFSISIFLFTIVTIIFFFNLGIILDVSQNPTKSDIIVCLGGGDDSRIKKSLELYEKKYSKNNTFIITGNKSYKKGEKDKRIEYIEKNSVKKINIIQINNTKNTREEIIFIKKFLIERNYKSAIIVSDAPHTRRIQSLISIINIENDESLQFNLVASNTNWWHKNTYYTNKRAKSFANTEIIKLGYSYIAYNILEPIGLLEAIESSSLVKYFRK